MCNNRNQNNRGCCNYCCCCGMRGQGERGQAGTTRQDRPREIQGIQEPIKKGETPMTQGDEGTPQAQAMVLNIGTAKNAVLNFTLPAGGEKATIPEINYYAGENRNAMVLEKDLTPIPLNTTIKKGITENEGILTINETGTYFLQYTVRADQPVDAIVGLLINGTNDEDTNFHLDKDHGMAIYNAIRVLNAGTTIQLVATAITQKMVLEEGTNNITLLIRKI